VRQLKGKPVNILKLLLSSAVKAQLKEAEIKAAPKDTILRVITKACTLRVFGRKLDAHVDVELADEPASEPAAK
jgi:hypothetical protein